MDIQPTTSDSDGTTHYVGKGRNVLKRIALVRLQQWTSTSRLGTVIIEAAVFIKYLFVEKDAHRGPREELVCPRVSLRPALEQSFFTRGRWTFIPGLWLRETVRMFMTCIREYQIVLNYAYCALVRIVYSPDYVLYVIQYQIIKNPSPLLDLIRL